jgi:hypothetical protein
VLVTAEALVHGQRAFLAEPAVCIRGQPIVSIRPVTSTGAGHQHHLEVSEQ